MSARPSRLAGCAALIVALAASSALAQARIDAVEGKVEVAPAGMKVWIAVSTPPYTMKEGDRVRTAPGASASIVFPDNSRVQLAAESAFAAERIRKGDAAMRLDAGELHAWVTKALSRHFRVTTAVAIAQARGTAFGVEVTPTKDTQVEVDKGVVAVKLKNGEETELGAGRAFRSLLVVPGRPLSLLPHPHEDAGGKKSPRGSVDCLHAPNGALRASVEEIEACQERARAKAGALSPAEELALREQAREEIKRFLTATGELPGGEADPGQASDGGDAQADGGGKRDTAAETASLMKEAGLPESAAAGPLSSLTPEKIKMLKDAMAKQGASPAIQAAFNKVTSGQGQLSSDELQALLKGLKLENVNLDPSGKTAPPPAASDAP